MKISVFLISIILLAGCEQQPSSGDKLQQLIFEWDEAYLKLNPFEATERGHVRFNDKWGVDPLSDAYRQSTWEAKQMYWHQLQALDMTQLSEEDLARYEALQTQLSAIAPTPVSFEQFFSRVNSLVLLGAGDDVQPFKTLRDYDNWILRSDGFSAHVDLVISVMKQEAKQSQMRSRENIEDLLQRLKPLLVDNVEDSPFWQPVINMPDSFTVQDQEQFGAIYHEHILNVLLPAYARLYNYIKFEYLPQITSG